MKFVRTKAGCCFEAPGVAPFCRGATAKDDALHYAKERQKPRAQRFAP